MAALTGNASAAAPEPSRTTERVASSSKPLSCDDIKAGRVKVNGATLCLKSKSGKKETKRQPLIGAQALPAGCSTVGNEQLLYNRTESCFRRVDGFQIIDSQGKVTGDGDLQYAHSAVLDVRSRTWTENTRVQVVRLSGKAAAGTTGFVSVQCASAACTSTPTAPQPLVVQTSNDYSVSVTSPGTSQLVHRPTPNLTIANPAAANPLTLPITNGTAGVRCDSNPGGGMAQNGCVYSAYVPTYEIRTDNADTDDVAWHVYWAQRNLKTAWGWKGHGPALQRLIDQTAQDANRRIACGDAPSIPGKSCDEYPFASTYQGANFNLDYSCHMINETDNSLEGTRYRQPFYVNNRLLDTDKFWVSVVGPGTTSAENVRAAGPVGCGGA